MDKTNERPKRLSPITKPPQTKTIWAFDTEDDSKGHFIQGSFYDGKKFHNFKSPEECIVFLGNQSPRDPIYLWACNLEYDLVNIFWGNFDLLELCYISTRIIYAKMRGRRIYFADTLNHWKLGVARMGETLGYKKMPFDPYNEEYCNRDTEIVWRWVSQYQKLYNRIGCTMKFTLPSSSMDLFRRNYLDRRYTRADEPTLDRMRLGYYGGRTEIFRTNKMRGRFFYVDINSMYPYVMRQEVYPDPDTMYESDKFEKDAEGVTACTIEMPDQHIPPLPIKLKPKLVFPIGSFKGVWANCELRYAIEKCGARITNVDWSINFWRTVRPFKAFIDDLYKRRVRAKTTLEKDMYKLFMNASYGKYAERGERWELVPIAKCKRFPAPVFDDMCFQPTVDEYPPHANVIWAVYVTAYSRILLHSRMVEVERKGGTLLYCDTDSMFYKAPKMLTENVKTLGRLKLEGRFRFAHFLLPKVYIVSNDKVTIAKAKGVKKEYAQELIEKYEVSFQRPLRLRESLHRNRVVRTDGVEVDARPNVWFNAVKRIESEYDKRNRFPDGHTTPLCLQGVASHGL